MRRPPPNFCADLTKDIGGEVFKGCYSVNAATQVVSTTFNESLCHDEVTSSCVNAANTTVPNPTIGVWDRGGGCESVATPQTVCTNTTDCTNAGVGTYVTPQMTQENVKRTELALNVSFGDG